MGVKPGYKQTEIGVIPEDWGICEFQVVMTGFSSGQTPSRTKPEYYTGSIPWITSGELNYGIITDTFEKITFEALEKTNLKIIPKGTFLFAITGLEAEGTRGSCGITGIDAATNQSCMALYPKNGLLLTEYLFHFYVRQGDWFALKYCQGTKQQSYNGHIAKKLPIILPSTLAEQTTIATALSDADALIQSLERLIAKKRDIKQGAMQELLTGKKRLPGFEKKKGYKQTEVGVIPEDWDIKILGDLFTFSGGVSASREQLSNDGHCYLHYGDIHTSNKTYIDAINEATDIPRLDIDIRKVPTRSLLLDGDIVFVDASEDDDGASKHIVVRNTDNRTFISGLHTVVTKSKGNTFNNLYKEYCFQTYNIKQWFRYYAVGTKVTGISKTNIVKIPIPIPPLSEQSAIATILSDMDAEIAALDVKLVKARQIKQGMMQELLTGRIRLT